MRRALFPIAIVLFFSIGCSNESTTSASNDDIDKTRRLEGEELVKRGEYLVLVGGCNDCHSPKTFSPHGMAIDTSKILSGHPAASQLPPVHTKSLQPGNWILMAPDVTAFVGPWGISRAANLTPDTATGIGNWTEENFIQALRKGKHLGMDNGRPILPPMPWQEIGRMTDEDLRAVYTYLKSLPPVRNRVEDPTPPNQVSSGTTAVNASPQQ